MLADGECGTVGIDVAWPQGPAIDWPSVERAGVRFAICKATQGASSVNVDPTFKRNRDAIRAETSIVFGAYHWLEPAQDPIAQAQHFVRTVGKLGELEFLAIDFEDDDRGAVRGAPLLACVLACAREIRRLTGRTPIIYTGKWFAAGLDSDELAEYPLWHAQYPNTKRDFRSYHDAVCALPDEPAIAELWRKRDYQEAIWQFDGDGGLYLPQGIDVDVNRFRGSEAGFVEFVRSLRVGEPLSPLEQGDVTAVQAALNGLGAKLDADGKLGPLTRLEISRFQERAGLESVGLLNEATLRALAAEVASLGVIALPPDPRGEAPIDARDVIENVIGFEIDHD